MAKGYWMLNVDVHDAQPYQDYMSQTPAILKQYGGRFIVRGGQHQIAEGETRARLAVIEFPTYQQAFDCWHSPEYQQAREVRLPASAMNLVIIEGYEGPQPGDSQ